MIDDARTRERIGASWLRAAIAPVSDFGRRVEDAALSYGPGREAEAQARCAQIVSLAARMAADGVDQLRAVLRSVPDPVDIVSRTSAGDPLGDVDFFELGRFADGLEAVARAWDATGGPPAGRPPVVPEIGALLAAGRDAASFYLADAFGAGLAAARVAHAGAEEAAVRERERLARMLLPVLGTLIEGEEFIAMRDLVPAVPPGTRIVRETPVYRLLAVELDGPALAAAARRDEALADVARQEELARRDLSVRIARHGPALLAAADALGDLDRTLARVAFTARWGGCVPALTEGETTAGFAFTAASFVPLRAALADAGLPYTPISLDLYGVAVLTGPNMGGKSAALATCGFLAACVAAGVPPPAERATLPLFGSVAWIGGDGSEGQGRLLSGFGSEVVRTRDVLTQVTPPLLLLVDEFARTTGPREGRVLLVALLEALARRGAFVLAATHFEGVARDAGVAHLAIVGLGERSLDPRAARDLHAALDAIAHAMDHRIVAVDAAAHANSDALALAGLLGLDRAIVERAAELYARDPAGPLEGVTE